MEELKKFIQTENSKTVKAMESNVEKAIGAAMSTLRADLTKEFDEKLKLRDDAINKKIDEMQAKFSRPMPATAACVAADETASKRARTGGSALRAASAPPSSSSSDPTKVWFLGFPRPLLGAALRDFMKKTVNDNMGPNLAKDCTYDGRNSSSLGTVTFPSGDAAKTFIDTIRVVKWTDPRTSTSHDVRVRPDRTQEQRDLGKLTAKLWSHTKALLSSRQTWTSETKMGIMKKNEFFMSDGLDIWILFTFGKAANGAFEANAKEDNFDVWGVTVEDLRKVTAQACAEANSC